MPIISISKEQELYIQQADFKEKHRVFPEEAHVARAIVNENLDIINHFITTGLVTEDRLDMIVGNDALQTKYALMVYSLYNGEKKLFHKMLNNVKEKPDLYCGWVYFLNEQMEEELDITLMPEPRLNYYYEDYLKNDFYGAEE